MIQLNVNAKPVQVDVAPDTPLLWALRDSLQLTGTTALVRPRRRCSKATKVTESTLHAFEDSERS